MNRAEKLARKTEWNKAISEGRVVNFGETVRSYNSAEAARIACEAAKADGFDAFIVPAELAQ